eukprot:5133350-Amphidinium_carterae.1
MDQEKHVADQVPNVSFDGTIKDGVLHAGDCGDRKGVFAIDGCGVLDQSGAFNARACCNDVLRYPGDTCQETQ